MAQYLKRIVILEQNSADLCIAAVQPICTQH
jgi:hypothetical protein